MNEKLLIYQCSDYYLTSGKGIMLTYIENGGISVGKSIEANEYQLLKIFSSDFDYLIPPYQRPYAWTEDEVITLFDDLFDFYKNEPNDNYFLGSIVLIKEEENPKSDVVDGQQRLTTLSILISCIASKVDDEYKRELQEYLLEPGKKSAGLEAKPRLTLRKKDSEFFKKYIQDLKVDELVSLDLVNLSEPQRHIAENADFFLTKIEKELGNNLEEIEKFSMFLLQRCYLVVVATSSENSAFRIFSVMNSRGLPLLPTDIIKSETIGMIEESKQEAYTSKWEEMEEELGRDDFNNLFMHLRMIYRKEKAKKNLLDEFRLYVLPYFKNNPKSFIDDVLLPYSSSNYDIIHCKFESTENSGKINDLLRWLNKIDNSDWMPPAILFYSRNQGNSKLIFDFTKKLERLAAFMHLTSKDINFRIKRYSLLLSEIQSNSALKSLELSEEEKQEFIYKLDGDFYNLVSKRRNYFILRLDSFVSDGAAEYSPKVLTIEHVLPQTINEDSQWYKVWFKDLNEAQQKELHNKWIHRIANLVPLTKRKNSAAQNYDFGKKKDIYFKGKKGTSSYALTTQVLNSKEWTEKVLKERQKEIMKVFSSEWDLR